MNDVLVRAENVHKAYVIGSEPLHVLSGASIAVRRGEFVAVMGVSGSGKSTLLHILGALDEPDTGSVWFDDVDVFTQPASHRERLRCATVGFVFQFYHLMPELNVLENVMFPCMVNSSVLGWLKHRSRARASAREMLDAVGLTPRAHHRPAELSGGERQRAAIARALVNRPELLLADEPTGNLDGKTGSEVMELLCRLHKQGQTIVMVTHDLQTASRADRRVLLEDGQIKAR